MYTYMYIYIYIYIIVIYNIFIIYLLSNTTCLTQVFFNSGEDCSTLWCSLTRRNTHKTSDVGKGNEGCDSSRFLNLKGGIPRSVGRFQ